MLLVNSRPTISVKEIIVMTRMLSMLFGGLMGLGLVSVAQSADRQRPEPAGPQGAERMFQRLDTNQDGRIVLDEIPDSAPDFVKQMLKRADANEDGVVTREEFEAAMRQRGPRSDAEPQGWGRPPMGHGFGPPEHSPRGERGRPQDARPGAGPRPADRPQATPARRPDAAARAPRTRQLAPGGWDPQVWFDRMDRDKDGKLSPEEFAAGMRLFHRGMTRSGQPPAAAPRSPRGRQAWGPGPMQQPPQAGAPWRHGPWGHGPMAQPPQAWGPWGGGPWGHGPMAQPPRTGRAWGQPWGQRWGQPPRMPGRSGFGAGMSAEQRGEIAKHMARARQQAEAAWKRAATMRDQMLKRWAQKEEGEADLQPDRERTPRVEPKEPKARKEADQQKKQPKQPKQPKAKPAND
ncbi:MAG: hypothetical protein EA424_26700 [Planctomycetaceae bacterium]|nr:MAG: hypothetical protein EA424_26700 [Planctomycetaceae bacterium]